MSKLIEAVEALRVRTFSGEGWHSAPMLDRADVINLIRKHETMETMQAYYEHRAHGGKLDFTAWQEREEREREAEYGHGE